MHERQNDLTWSSVFNDMFQVPKQDCTPDAVLQTMHALTEIRTRTNERKRTRKALTLDDIVHHAKIRNVDCTPDSVLACLRTLYRERKIRHRVIADNHRFLVETL